MCWSVYLDDHGWARYVAAVFIFGGAIMFLRGILYRPDEQLIHESYIHNRTKPEFRDVVDELDTLARALAQDLKTEDYEAL